ncbi:hypothetical protein ACLESO_41215, partial [Pyxidicoccus sp. 3LG]
GASGTGTGGTGATGTGASGGATGGGGTGGGSASAAGSGAATGTAARPESISQEVSQLRAQVQRLQQDVDALRRGGSATGGSGTGGSGAAAAPVPDVDPNTTVVASVQMQGQVTAVGKDRIQVRDAETGDLYTLFVGKRTRALVGNKPISVQRIPEGAAVRAAFNQSADGDAFATRLQVYPAPRPEQPQQRPEQPQQR